MAFNALTTFFDEDATFTKYAFAQRHPYWTNQKISNWIAADRRVDDFPVGFISALAVDLHQPLERVYQQLVSYEELYTPQYSESVGSVDSNGDYRTDMPGDLGELKTAVQAANKSLPSKPGEAVQIVGGVFDRDGVLSDGRVSFLAWMDKNGVLQHKYDKGDQLPASAHEAWTKGIASLEV